MSQPSHLSVQTLSTPSGPVADTVVVCPKVGEREAEIVQQELTAAGERHRWHLMVDFTQVTFLTSVGLGVLVTLLQRSRKNGGRLVLFGIRRELMDLLKITHLDRVLTIVPDRDAAIRAMS